MNDNYSDIIHLPHHVSTRHPQMPMISRAAQFAPFSALTGLDDAMDETAQQQIAEIIDNDQWIIDNEQLSIENAQLSVDGQQ